MKPFTYTVLFLLSISCSDNVISPSRELRFTPDDLPQGTLGISYKATISISENTTPVANLGISKGSLPPGLELLHLEVDNEANIIGTPEEKGIYSFTIQVWCYGTMQPGQAGSKNYEIEIVTPSQ